MKTANEGAPGLWNPEAAGCWSLLFSPVFGSIVVSKNWRSIGQPRRASEALFWAYPWIGLFVISVVFEVSIPSLAFLVYLLVWYFVSCRPQAKYLKQRFGAYYPRKDWAVPLGIGLVCLVGTTVFVTGLHFALRHDHGESVRFGNDAVYFTDGVSEDEARAVGVSLRNIGLYQGAGAAAKIGKKGNDYVLSFAVRDGAWDDPAVVSELTEAGQEISKEVFPGQVVVLQLSNDHFEAQKKVIISDNKNEASRRDRTFE